MDEDQWIDLATLYSTAEAAELLKVSRSSIYRWIKSDALGHFRLGGAGRECPGCRASTNPAVIQASIAQSLAPEDVFVD